MQASNIQVTSNVIIMKAKDLWPICYPEQGDNPSKFSNGWLSGFKERKNIRRFKQAGEAADIDYEGGDILMQEVYCKASKYMLENQYNMDETGLYWQ